MPQTYFELYGLSLMLITSKDDNYHLFKKTLISLFAPRLAGGLEEAKFYKVGKNSQSPRVLVLVEVTHLITIGTGSTFRF